MKREELDDVLSWAASEGWNPGLEDAEAFFAADPGGFFVAVDGTTLVAAISVVSHSESTAFLGLYLCKPSHRGRGIGYGLWQHAVSLAGGRTIGLDGVPDQQANYERAGFKSVGGTTRYEGTIAPLPDLGVRLATEADIPDLIAREAVASGWRKTAYLTNWFTQCATRKTIVLNGDAGEFAALTVRACQTGAKVGPLLTDTAASADRLLRHAASYFSPELVVDVPNQSNELAAICQQHDMTPGFHTARMYKGKAPAIRESIYAVTSLELG